MTLGEFTKFQEQANQRRGMSFNDRMARIGLNLSAVEGTVRRYRVDFERFREMLEDGQYVDRCLRCPLAYYDAVDRMQFDESVIRQLMEEIQLDRAEIEISVGQDLVFAPKPGDGRSDGPPGPVGG